MKLKVVHSHLTLFCVVLASSLALAVEQPAGKGGPAPKGGGGGGVSHSGGSGGGGAVVKPSAPETHQTNRPSNPTPVKTEPGKVNPGKGDNNPVVVGKKNPTNTKVDNKGQPHPVITRPPGSKPGIHADPHTPRVALGPRHQWNPIHRDGRWDRWHRTNWLDIWADNIVWSDVTQVTCEAVNTQTGVFYPVTAYNDGWTWSDQEVNDLEEEALDDCLAVSNDESLCIPESDECTPVYVSTTEPVYVPAQAH